MKNKILTIMLLMLCLTFVQAEVYMGSKNSTFTVELDSDTSSINMSKEVFVNGSQMDVSDDKLSIIGYWNGYIKISFLIKVITIIVIIFLIVFIIGKLKKEKCEQ